MAGGGGGDSGGGGNVGLANSVEVSAVGGSQSVSSATFVDIAGTGAPFTLAATGLVRIDGSVSVTIDNPALDASCEPEPGINVNGVDYALGLASIINVTGFLPVYLLAFHKYVTLPAGTYTATLRMKKGGAKNVIVLSSAAAPSICSVAY
jgi:hypothetical protein